MRDKTNREKASSVREIAERAYWQGGRAVALRALGLSTPHIDIDRPPAPTDRPDTVVTTGMKRDRHTEHFLIRAWASTRFAEHAVEYFLDGLAYFPDLPDMDRSGYCQLPMEWRGASRDEEDLNSEFVDSLDLKTYRLVRRLKGNANLHAATEHLAAELVRRRAMSWGPVESFLRSEMRKAISPIAVADHRRQLRAMRRDQREEREKDESFEVVRALRNWKSFSMMPLVRIGAE
jgi:hypothetical protein